MFLTALVLIGGVHAAGRLQVSPDEVAVQLRALTAGAEDDRVAAIKWVLRHYKATALLPALPQLEAAARGDGPGEVRGMAVLAAGKIAHTHGRPCPPVVFDLLGDEDAGPYASMLALPLFDPLPPEGVAALVKYATGPNPRHREGGTFLLAEHARHSPEAVKVIRAAREDKDFWVRHAGHLGVFRVTDKLDDLLPYLLRFQAESWGKPELPPDAADAEKAERARRNLSVLWSAWRLASWTETRPADVRDTLLALLGDQDKNARHDAAEFVGRLAKGLADGGSVADPVAKLIPKPDGTGAWDLDPKKQRAGMAVVALAPGVRVRLKALSAKDPDEAVRSAADVALLYIAEAERKK